MPLFNEPNLTSGIDDAIITTAESVPAFPIMILVFTFLMIFLGGTSNQKRRLGVADYPFWSVLASLGTFFLALIFTIGDGLIDLGTITIVLAITIMCGFWFFMSKVRGEE